MTKTFKAKLERPPGTGTWTYLTVPFNVEEVFGKRERVAVKGTIDGAPFQGSLMPHGDGYHFIVVKKELRQIIGKEAGATVQVELAADTEPRVLNIPEAFARALKKNPQAKTAFDQFSYSHRKEYVEWIESAKKPETRDRRILEAIEMIASGKRPK